MNLKIPIRKVSLAYKDFVNEKIVEIEKKVGNWGKLGVRSIHKAL